MRSSIKQRLRSFLCLTLALSMLGAVGCKKKPETPAVTTGGEPLTEAPNIQTPPDTLPPLPDDLKYLSTAGKSVLRAAYVGRMDTEPLSVGMIGTDAAPHAAVGATWKADGITLNFTGDAATYTAKLGNTEKTLTASGGKASGSWSFDEIGMALTDMGQLIPLTATAASGGAAAGYDGFVMLNDYTTFAAYDCDTYAEVFKKASISRYQSIAAVSGVDAGAKAENGSVLIYDNYAPGKTNIPYLRNLVSSQQISDIAAGTKHLIAEFDLTVHSMPVYGFAYETADVAYGLSFVLSEGEGKESVMLTFINTGSGFSVFVNGADKASTKEPISTGKRVGESFRVGAVWHSGDLDIYINGSCIGSFEDASINRSAGYGTNTASFVWQRNANAAASAADSFSASVDNLGFGFLTDFSLIETLSVNKLISGEPLRVEGEETYLAASDLTLAPKLENSKYGLSSQVYWYSSNTAVIGNDGKLTRPADAGELVDLTAYLVSGEYVVSQKTYHFFVKASAPKNNVLWLKNDRDPFSGSGSAADTTYFADSGTNSIIYDMGSVTAINRAELNSRNPLSRITKNFVALYASDDNKSYTAIPDFTMVETEGKLTFFNFNVNARYLKIHFTYRTAAEQEVGVFNSLQKQMTAYHSTRPLMDGGADFARSATLTVSNSTDQVMYNRILSYTLTQLGIAQSELKDDLSDIRFRADGMELPHYYSNGRFFVRVPQVPANGSTAVTVLYGNPSAASVSDGTATLEVEYGTKYVMTRGETGAAWRNSVEVMPDGSLLMMGDYDGKSYLGMERSEDGGHTWSRTVKIPTTAKMKQGGGFIVDYEANVVYFMGYGESSMFILKSTDSGKNWSIQTSVSGGGIFTYSDGIKLKDADGAGANVDYVFTCMVSGATDGSDWSVFASSLYSKDGGNSWVLSDSRVAYGSLPENTYWASHESGCSEETVWEQADGTLIMYARYQGYDDVNQTLNLPRLVVAYSKDHGVTWEKELRLSTFYSTNTQPIIADMDGTPLLLWGGNNSAAFRSYDRFPLNIAWSANDAEDFVGILDISYQTEIMNRIEYRPDSEKYIVTNPDIAIFEKGGVKCAFIVITNYFFLIENFENYLYKTKGAFDSFESGDLAAEGWITVSGTTVEPGGSSKVPGELPYIGTLGATEGKYALQLGSQTQISRSVPYAEKGELFFDVYVDKWGGGFQVELQSAYNRQPGVSAPIRLWFASNGEVYCYDAAGKLQKTELVAKAGNNQVSVAFDCTAGTATLTVNGQSQSIACNNKVGTYICFVHVNNASGTATAWDRFGLVDLD